MADKKTDTGMLEKIIDFMSNIGEDLADQSSLYRLQKKYKLEGDKKPEDSPYYKDEPLIDFRKFFSEGSDSAFRKRVEELMDDGYDFGAAVKEVMKEEEARKNLASGGILNYAGNMMRSNYAMGSEDIPEMEEMASDEYRDLLKSLNAPTEDQASGIMGLDQGAPSIKMAGGTDPMLLREYEQYVFEMQEMGREPMDLKSFIRQLLAEARMGVKDGGRMNYAQGTPKLMGNPAVVTEIKNMRENQIMNPDVEDVADYKTYYKKLKAQDEEIKRMLDKAKKEKQKRAKGGIAGVL